MVHLSVGFYENWLSSYDKNKQTNTGENITFSLSILTAIFQVDLG